VERANEAVKKLEAYCERPFITPSIGVLKGVEAIGKPRRLGILTPYFGPAGEMVANFFRSAGYEAARVVNMEAKGPTNVAKISFDTIRAAVDALDAPEVEAFVHVGTALCVSGLTAGIEKKHGKPLIGVNVATYWAALRAAGVRDALPGFGLRFCLAPVQAIIFSLEPGAHSRIKTFYITTLFAGQSVGSFAASAAWLAGGWQAVCLTAAGIAMVAALVQAIWKE